MFKLFNREEEYLCDLQPLKAKNKEKLNGEDILTLTLSGDIDISKKYRVLVKVGSDWKEFIVEEVEEDRIEATKEIYAESSLYELLGDYIEDKRAINYTANSALGLALDGPTRWEVGTVDYLGENTATFYRTNALEAVREICHTWQGEIRTRIEITGNKITSRKIDIFAQRGNFLGERFVTGENISKITRTIHTDQVVTALYGYGKGEEVGGGFGRRIDFAEVNGGISYVEDDEARLLWGRLDGVDKAHIFGKIEFDDVEDKEELLSLTRSKLEELSKPKVTYEGEIVGAESHLGDTVVIIDETFTPQLRLTSRIFELERDLIDEKRSKPVLGNFIDTLSSSAIEQKKVVDKFRGKSGIWDRASIIGEDGTINAQYLDDLIGALNQRMNSQGGYVFISEDGQGLITYDAPTEEAATMAIQLIGGGFRIANSKLADGNWNWRTFGDGNGFIADEFIGGVLKGGKVNFDLTNGTLLIGESMDNYSLFYDGTNLVMSGDIQFTDGGAVVAWINGQQLYIRSAVVTENLQIGDMLLSAYENGVTMNWVGE